MPMAASDIERLIRARIPDAEVTIRDLAGDGDHYAATVIAESFRGKSRVQQHQIVYEALKTERAASCTRWRCRPARRNADQPFGSRILVKGQNRGAARRLARLPAFRMQCRHGSLPVGFACGFGYIYVQETDGIRCRKVPRTARKDDRDGYRAIH